MNINELKCAETKRETIDTLLSKIEANLNDCEMFHNEMKEALLCQGSCNPPEEVVGGIMSRLQCIVEATHKERSDVKSLKDIII